MPKLWGRPLVPAALVSVLALVLWPILGGTQALAAWAGLLLVLFLHHVSNLSQLFR